MRRLPLGRQLGWGGQLSQRWCVLVLVDGGVVRLLFYVNGVFGEVVSSSVLFLIFISFFSARAPQKMARSMHSSLFT